MVEGPMNLGGVSEDDVVAAFKFGLQAFIEGERGRFGARRVTLRQEKVFPSDLDIALWFQSEGAVQWHLFGLQFKRWNGTGWSLSAKQFARLSRLGHVIAYCFPSPGESALANMLYAFRFVNPRRIPDSCSDLILLCPAQFLLLGVSPASLAESVQQQFTMELALQDRIDKGLIFPTPYDDKIGKLRRLIGTAGQKVKEKAEAMATEATVAADSEWGQSLIASERAIVPHLTWFDFFNAAKQGSTVVEIPDNPGPPPDPSDPPGNVSFGSGIGLVLRAGPGGDATVRASLASHVDFWTRTALEPPAAVVAYESFSRSLQFIEYPG
jgi:hypothetical protein